MSDSDNQNPPTKSTPTLTVLNGDPKPRRDDSVKKKDIHAMIVEAMIGDRVTRWPKFPVRLHKWTDHAGETLFYEEDDRRVVHRISPARIESLVAAYWVDVSRTVYLGTMTADDAAKTRKLWAVRAEERRAPFKILSWASDPGLAYHRMPYDPDITTPTPLFDELLSRASNSTALRAWIGSLFDEHSQRQQYLWIYGSGENGKGSLLKCLTDALGPAAASEHVPRGGRVGNFWSSGLVGKRLVVFGECEEPGFVTSGFFKGLSGGDDQRVEIKGGAILSMALPAKFIFASNDRPAITGNRHDTRRVIYSAFGAVTAKYHGNYAAALAAELPSFLSHCWAVYRVPGNADGNGMIVTANEDELTEVVADTEHEEVTFVEGYLRFSPKGIVTARALREKMIAAGYERDDQRRKIRRYLELRCGITVSAHRWSPEEASVRGCDVSKVFKGIIFQ